MEGDGTGNMGSWVTGPSLKELVPPEGVLGNAVRLQINRGLGGRPAVGLQINRGLGGRPAVGLQINRGLGGRPTFQWADGPKPLPCDPTLAVSTPHRPHL